MYQPSWNDGSLQYNSPRLLQDLKSHVLLLSAVYSCKNGHKLLSHDERVLAMPSFRLSSFTRVVSPRTDLSFPGNGSSTNALAMLWREKTSVKWVCKQHWCYWARPEFHIASFTQVYAKYFPSDDALCQCFVTSFLRNGNKYQSHLQFMPGRRMLECWSHIQSCLKHRVLSGWSKVGLSVWWSIYSV